MSPVEELHRADRLGPLPGVPGAVELDHAPEVRQAFEAWMRLWRPWAERERLRRPRLTLFEQLFDLHRMAADRPESVELVVAAGLLHAPGEQGVRVHLVTQPVRIDQDTESGDMVCVLAEESAVRLEDDELLAGKELYDPSGSAVLRERLFETVTSPLDPELPAFLKEWAERALRVANAVSETWDAPTGREVQVAPALVARRRSAFALREYYDAISRSLADDSEPVPLGLAQLVEAIEPEDRVAWLERTGGTTAATLTDEPLFPLPANEEQAQIVNRLWHDSGVVVEGPPGTGKTHTIANLVSALLARGQRVLVTSEKAQALRVLREKLPEPMQELCVSLTDASARGNSDLCRSVATLAAAKTDFHPERTDRRIGDLTARRNAVLSARARLLEQIRALRESETYEHPEIAPGYGGTLARIARALSESTDRWVPGDAAGALPLSGDELSELLQLLRTGTEQRESRRSQQLPAPEQLPAETRVRELAIAVAEGDAARAGEVGELVVTLGSLPGEQLLALEPACRRAADAIAVLRSLPAERDWALAQVDMLLSGNGLYLWQRAIGQLGLVDAAVELDQRAGFLPMHVAGDLDSAAAAVFDRFAAHLAGGGSLRRVFKSSEQKDAERYATSVQVNGAPVATAESAAVATTRSAGCARAELGEAVTRLRDAVPPGARSPELDSAVQALRAADAEDYVKALISFATARTQQRDQFRCDELADRLRRACPALIEAIAANPHDAVWSGRLPRWPHAWACACAATWIACQTAAGREQQLEGELSVAVRDLGTLTADLTAALAWRSCLSRMTARQVQALQSYRGAMANVGAGTGKYVEKFRQSAREAMAVAQSAVPAWVMPIQQVLASVPAQPGAFDVVIVDEASQAELTSTFLLWLAPRVIVVGDDKQCTPSEVSSGALQPVFDRLESELHDLPSYLRTAFTPKDSIFSLLRSRFGQVVRLREHFRCMPEIITWSSNEFYRDAPLVPVRQFGANRLPPLRTSYVEGAYQEGSGADLRNPVEADAIVDSVVACLEDPAYEGRTFGVVVLQGHAQVDVIKAALAARISPEQWEERRLRVSTPPDFQGDERHVVWLSMVVAPDQNFVALTRREFQQRFNVAASRAQDQLWLFHAVTADLLRITDLRRSLLTYMRSTDAAPLRPMLTGVQPDRRHEAFDSLFEQRVFLDIGARGYHVTPQVEANGRRIDLVVTGAAGKLAVECDGDAFHTTPEQGMADLQREQELKRCGWTFWRIRESRYYLDREKELASLWAELDRLAIAPFSDTSVNGTPLWRPVSRLEDADEPVEQTLPLLDSTPSLPLPPMPAPNVDLPPPPEADAVTVEPVIVGQIAQIAQIPEPRITPTAPSWPAATPASKLAAPSNETRELLLQMAGRAPLSSARVAKILAIGQEQARELLAGMVLDGALVRTGQARGTRYVLPDWTEVTRRNTTPVTSLMKVSPMTTRPVRNLVVGPEQRNLVLRALKYRPLTNESVRGLLETDAAAALEILTALVEEGELERKGQGRGTYYVQAAPTVAE